METRANHFLIGLFTLLVVAGAFGFVYWLARLDDASGRTSYYVMFDSAVTGLNTGSSVMFNGIKVGEVANLAVDPDKPGRVRALIKVDPAAPVKRDTVAQLEYQGLTGVGIVQLLGGTVEAGALMPDEGQEIPVIIARKGQLQGLLEAGEIIMTKGGAVLERLDTLLGSSQDSISATIGNVEKFTGTLARNSDRIDSFFNDASALANRLNTMSSGLDDLIKGINALVGEGGGELMKNVGSAFKRIDNFMGANEDALGKTITNLEAFTGTLSRNKDTMELVMKDAARLAAKLNTVSDDISRMVNRTDGLIAEDGASFLREARLAAETFRKMTSELSGKIDAATEGLNRLSGRSIKEFETFALEGRTTMRDMQRLMERLERNPQRFFFGRSQVPETPSR